MKYTDISNKRKYGMVLCIMALITSLGGCGNAGQQTSAQVQSMQEIEKTEQTVNTTAEESGEEGQKSVNVAVEDVDQKAVNTTGEENGEEGQKSVNAVIEDADQKASNTTVEEAGKESQKPATTTAKQVDKGNQSITGQEKREPVKVKGIYVSGPIAGNAKMDELIDLVDTTELNAMVIDIKNDDGRITYQMDSDTLASEIGANINYVSDMKALVKRCKEKNIYLIARVVAFKDPYLAQQRPELAVKTKAGDIFHDKSGLAWVNPYNREVWDYLVEIGTQAAKIGFDEVQFDYIRFSTDLKTDKLDFGAEAENKSKTDIITQFTQYAYDKLSKEGVYVAADVYGTVIDSKIDQDIVGQNFVDMASHLDYICPMVYPSHYANGVYGIPIPDAQPYDTVKAAMQAAAKQLEKIPEKNRATGRVWIQSFTASWVEGHISYGPKQIRAQIQGAHDAGFDEWILWNAAVNYKRDALLTEAEAKAEQESWDSQKNTEQLQTGESVADPQPVQDSQKNAEQLQTGESEADMQTEQEEQETGGTDGR